MEYALEMRGINKAFSGVQVLKDVDFTVKPQEIHALLGENGAGKTTLMNILGGVIDMDGGSVSLLGENNVSLTSAAAAQAKGIAFVHQELNVVNDLTVYENLFLGQEVKTKFGSIDSKFMIDKTNKVFERMHVAIDPKMMVRDLQASYKQIVEIARAVLMDAKLIIMDEPTTSLTQKEVDNVFGVMRKLIEQGASIIFISHKLGEVVDFCDSATVLRNGENAGIIDLRSNDQKQVGQADIARMMVGKNVLDVDVYKPHPIKDVIFEAKNICVDTRVKDVSFKLRAGEILGITGLLGDGKDELVRSLFGDLPINSGSVEKDGKPIQYNHPAKAKKLGIGMLPANRKENAIIKDLSVMENMTIVTLDKYRTGLTLKKVKEQKVAEEYREKLQIKIPDLKNLIVSLSGGNQQKIVIAKWLAANPDIMILCNPTQGVDVGAKNEIYNIIMELANSGMGIIITSGESQEVLKICDRILVMYHGVLKGELSREEMTEEAIMILSTGGQIVEEGAV